MAEHLEKIQWKVRPANLLDETLLGDVLPVSTSKISEVEVEAALSKLRRNRAAGPDDIPAEYWQAVADTEKGLQWLTELCNRCWRQQKVPQQWSEAHVKAIYKKGDSSLCDNYRPISLLCVAYKLFSAILLRRIQRGGAEDRLSKTQFGFRRHRGTEDAIFAARRHIENAWAGKSSQVSLLALD